MLGSSTTCRTDASSPAHGDNATLAHQPRDSLAPHTLAQLQQILYTAFQTAFVLAFLCLFKWLTSEGETRWWFLGFVAASLAAVTLHELSVVLAPCLLIPLVDRRATASTRVRALVAAAAFLGAWAAYRRLAGPWLVSLAPPSGLEPVMGPESANAAVPDLPPAHFVAGLRLVR